MFYGGQWIRKASEKTKGKNWAKNGARIRWSKSGWGKLVQSAGWQVLIIEGYPEKGNLL